MQFRLPRCRTLDLQTCAADAGGITLVHVPAYKAFRHLRFFSRLKQDEVILTIETQATYRG